ncbi:MAG: prepilin-type N-terminal cleavage/methylation domain-containing protein [Gemmatimonadales bacterium]
MTTPRRLDERGLTLIEMLVALVVFSAVLAGALAFLRAQSRSFSLGSQRVAMMQNARFTLDVLERDLRTAGTGAPDIQPPLIYLGASVLAFNANHVTNTPGDVFAVYNNPDAPSGSTAAMIQADRATIPLTAVAYPDTTYLSRGVNSPAETIVFFFLDDTSTSRTDDFVLYRQVNTLAPEVVARNLLQTTQVPFLQYYRQSTSAFGAGATIQQVPNVSVPLQHVIPIHLAVNDTGPVALIDSVRAVQVSFMVTNGLSGAAERQRAVSRYIRLPNVGLANKKTCGDEPILGAGLAAVWNPVVGGVDLQWNSAVDELTGEQDVERYVIWRKLSTDLDWGDPFLSLPPAGSPTYLYTDRDVTAGTTYSYGLAAQDCTPTNSSIVASSDVAVP